ncbi:hypothetical protein E2C01_012869 [Portunus trituberculatus]|uniref:Uncharacterized protein n=1 Tax=Portunus trituberculatus TaxID=210409 RepID=A0A5B7DF05_PORTR|nr:hypothetical protein [Portunus trituberculatus]
MTQKRTRRDEKSVPGQHCRKGTQRTPAKLIRSSNIRRWKICHNWYCWNATKRCAEKEEKQEERKRKKKKRRRK